MSFSKIAFGAFAFLALGTLAIAAPGGHVLIGTPPNQRVVRDPSVRAGSPRGHGFFVFGSSGGYHGGK